MSNQLEEPIFNIGAVARMTAIPEATLRIWERRYHFPQSARTSGGHRLYSQQNVFWLQWVKARIDEGIQVSQAIRALQRAGHLGGTIAEPAVPSALVGQVQEGAALSVFHGRLLAALLEHNVEEANLVLSEALVLYPLEPIILEVIGPILREIGAAWAAGQVDVATEHLATNHLRHQLLLWMRIGPPAYAVEPVVLACAPGELHEGSLLMLGVLLRRLRWPVVYLGQTMPLAHLSGLLADVEPAIVVFVAMTEETARALVEWPRWLPTVAEQQRPLVSFGGRAFVEQSILTQQVPGLYLGPTLQEGVQTLNRILHELNPLLR
ncbi:MAG: MerR family transcriptional regulator [Caldilinea sp. CFX5]|nr:MerR family transcriptional regulator [Caldilinea sp. CFX5]